MNKLKQGEFMMNAFMALFLLILISCAAHVSEHSRYLQIKSLLAKDRYSAATNEIFKLEKEYPKSEYLCELWGIQIAYFKDKDTAEKFVLGTEKKRNDNCDLMKSTK